MLGAQSNRKQLAATATAAVVVLRAIQIISDTFTADFRPLLSPHGHVTFGDIDQYSPPM